VRDLSTKEIAFLIILFIFALSLRLVYLGQLQGTPWFNAPIEDAGRYDDWAQSIQKDWMQTSQPYHEGVFFQAPLYPYLLAVIYTFLGHSYLTIRIIQSLLGSCSVLLIYFLGKRVFNSTVAKVAAVLASLYGTLIYFEGELLLPSFILFVNLLLLLAVLSAAERPGWWRWLACGALMGLSAIARPNILIFLVVLVPWMLVSLRRRGHPSGKPMASVLALVAGVILLIAPVTVRNYVAAKDFVPISSQGGVNFYIGNNPGSDGSTPLLPGARASWWGIYYDSVQLAQEAEGRPLEASQVSNYWFKRGLEFMSGEPGLALRLMLRKLALFWGGPEVANNKDIYFFSRWTSLLRMLLWRWYVYCPFGIIAPLALAGMVLALFRREGAGAGLLALFVFIYMFSVILFFVTARFRMPVIPFLILFSAYCLVGVFRERRFMKVILALCLILIFGLAVNLNLGGYAFAPAAESHNRLGSVYLGKKLYAEAEQEFQQALSDEPDYVYAVAGLARVYGETDRTDEAIKKWERAVALRPRMMEFHFQLGFSYYASGRLDEAISSWEEAARLQPEFAQPHFQLGIAYDDRGDHLRAIEEYQKALQVNPRYILAHYNLAHLYKKLGRIDEAIGEFQQAIEKSPNFGDAYNSLAWLYAQVGIHLDEGVELANRALELDPGSAAYWDTLAELYIRLGRFDKAREIFQQRMRREPQEPFWKQRLEEIGG
jgi:tetratricopeptide (TPR) repeat protein